MEDKSIFGQPGRTIKLIPLKQYAFNYGDLVVEYDVIDAVRGNVLPRKITNIKTHEALMTNEIFDKLLDNAIEHIRAVLSKKAGEYATDNDRLSNFKRAAALNKSTDLQALKGMLTKHIVSIYDMIDDGKEYPVELWQEKLFDAINYILLAWGLVNEAGGKPKKTKPRRFENLSNIVILDNETGLEWLARQEYATYRYAVDSLSGSWRIPTIVELQALQGDTEINKGLDSAFRECCGPVWSCDDGLLHGAKLAYDFNRKLPVDMFKNRCIPVMFVRDGENIKKSDDKIKHCFIDEDNIIECAGKECTEPRSRGKWEECIFGAGSSLSCKDSKCKP